ncbi:MAG: hypothetical protein HYV59_12580 [Planctomycetes bacterium]|nr:hypothetical protein [Planctomycetota bacterium]
MFREALKLITLKLVGGLTVLPFLAGIIAFGLVYPFVSIKQSTSVALFIFGIVGITEHSYRVGKTNFLRILDTHKRLMADDSETFLKFSDRVLGIGKWKAVYKDITIYGLVFRNTTTDRSSAFQTVDGPRCPLCKGHLSYTWVFRYPFDNRCRYYCPCGFTKTMKETPETLYKIVRTHFNLPLM